MKCNEKEIEREREKEGKRLQVMTRQEQTFLTTLLYFFEAAMQPTLQSTSYKIRPYYICVSRVSNGFKH